MSVLCGCRLSPAMDVYQRMCNIHRILNDLAKLLMTSCFKFVLFYHDVLICYYWRGTHLYFTHLFIDVNFIAFK